MGYGYGVGLFLKPQASESLLQSIQKAQGMLSYHTWFICACLQLPILATSDHHPQSHPQSLLDPDLSA